jgi:hypothetical protein
MRSFPDSYERKKICIFGPIMQRTLGKRASKRRKKKYDKSIVPSVLEIIILEEKRHESRKRLIK